jgi:EmrB/QacA subfamily drug resistance transporter
VSLADTGQHPPVAPQETNGGAQATGEAHAPGPAQVTDGAAQATNGAAQVTGRVTESQVGVPPSGQRLGWLLAVCCAAQFMVILDLSIVNVALPSIQASLNFSSTQLQWVVDAYAIVFAGFLMLGGRAADYLGQRRVMVVSLLMFALTSAIGGASVDHQMLIIARAAQGLSAALMAATSLSVITASFPAGPARHRAIGLWGAMNGAGGAVGTLLGGALTQELSWRWILLINPPIGIAAAIVARRVVAERRKTNDRPRFDLAGALTLTVGELVVVYGVVNAGQYGWTSLAVLGPVIVGVGLLAAFGIIEARFATAPLVPLKVLKGALRVANVIVLLFSAALFPMWYVSSLYLQQVLGLSPLVTGLTFLPMALVIFLCASQAGKLVGRFGVKTVLGSGLVLMASGMLLFSRIGASGSALGYVVLPGVLMAAGIGLSIVPSTILATQGAGPAQAGLASGLVNTSRQAGGGLGLALLISLATSYTSSAIGRNVTVPVALTDGFRVAYLVGAGLLVAAAAVTFVFVAPPVVAPAGRRYRLVLSVAVLAAVFAAVDFGFAGSPGAPIGAYKLQGAYDFVSAPGLHPPQLVQKVPTITSELAPGYIMVANFYDLTTTPMVGQSGPLILNNDLQPVWFRPVPKNVVASNLTSQTYKGQPVLTWWQGVVSDTGATESGEDVIVNQHYQTVATLKGADGWVITLHELVIRGGDAWVTANKDIPMNLSKYGGTVDGVLDDSAVQEYDIATGKLLYSWDALTHIPLTASHAQPPANGFPWDAYHVNSISFSSSGDFLVSMRNTWAAYMVEASTGAIQWELGGKNSSFRIPTNASFEWQHDVDLGPGSTITLFDDDCCQITGAGTYLAPAGPSRAEELKLDAKNGTVAVVAQYGQGQHLSTAYMGDTQVLPDGNVLVGWGSQPYLTEYTHSGKLVLDAAFPSPDLSYRATLGSWVGLPEYPPSAAARSTSKGTTVYASWNGDTAVVSWRVVAGTTKKDLSVVATATKSGFETQVSVKGSHPIFEVEALNSQGQVIGTSKSFRAN